MHNSTATINGATITNGSVAGEDKQHIVTELRCADNTLFTQSPILQHLAAWADARGSSRIAVLAQVLMRTALAIPPSVVIPARLGGDHAGLSLLLALVGESSGGKGRAEAVGRDAIALRSFGQLRRVEPLSPSTGEGLVSIFADSRRDGGRVTTVVHTPAALLSYKDIESFEALVNRSGATLATTLLSLYMGDTLGFVTREAARRVVLPAHTVVGGLSAGMQPGKGRVLLSEEMRASGMPQRFLWTPVRAGRRVTRGTPPPPLTVDLPDFGISAASPYDIVSEFAPGEGVDTGSLVELGVTEQVAAEVLAADVEKDLDVFGAVPAGEDQLAGHLNLTRLKVAAALAALHGGVNITTTWWELAGIVMDVSLATQSAVQYATFTAQVQDEGRKGELLGHRQAAAETTRDSETLNDVVSKLYAKVGRDWGTVNSKAFLTPRKQQFVEAAWDRLISEGKVEERPHPAKRLNTVQYRRIT